jgi:hypothetical protein
VKTFTFTVSARLEIEAENVVDAFRLARSVQVIGERIGARRPGPHDRDFITHSISVDYGPVVTLDNVEEP